ncbi:MAG: sulfite exporter TauE/SafE family protein, partial [Dechloromonas sp.]|nr:sulfite exporter TauE/SafE family protein [Dechloromonas sp.]
ALGTSMATIFFTSISSVRTHHAHGAVLWPIVLRITPGIIAGTLIGTHVASLVPTKALALIFTLFICYVSVQMIINLKPQPHRELPGALATGAVGAGIGFISCLVAIGGGVLSVPFMTWCNVKMQNAIGTSAAIGFPIALGGALGYIWNGWAVLGWPWGFLGFLFFRGVVGVGGVLFFTAPIGARLTHQLPVKTLKRVFAGILLALAGKMMWGVFSAP